MTRIGFAQTNISCALGTPLGGNARVDKAARGVHDPLHATVVVIQSDRGEQVIVGLDLLCAPRVLVEAISAAIESRTGIPASGIVVSATHTHSGPDVGHGEGMDQQDYSLVDAWEEQAVPAIAAAALAAQRDAVAASLHLASAEVGDLSFNRRLIHRDGSTHMNWESFTAGEILGARGPIDPELLVLVFSDKAGATIGALVHFTLHPAILVGHDWLVSADFVAEASNLLSRELNGAPVLFLNGALGNINHLDYRDRGRAIGFTETARVGTALGQAGVEALARQVREVDLNQINLRSITVTLDQRTVNRAQLEQAQKLIDANAGRPVEALDGIPAEAYAYWTVARGRALTGLLDVKVSILRLGLIVLVYLPFEVFVEFGLDLRRAFPEHVVRVVSLGGGHYGYLPTALAFAEGGYEPTFGTSTIEPGQGEYLFHHIATELRDMLGNNPIDENRERQK
jgi:neutral ceramidase